MKSFALVLLTLLVPIAGSRQTAAPAATANSAAVAEFSIPGHGKLRMPLPTGWKIESSPLAQPPAVKLHFAPPSSDSFDMQVTAVWLDSDKLAKESPSFIHVTVHKTGENDIPHAVEKTLFVQDFRGPQSYGSYFSLTDNDPGPGYPYMVQGIFLTGPALAPFTILTRAPNAPEVAQALSSFTNATFVNE